MRNEGGSAFPVNTTRYERDGEVVDVHVDTDPGMSMRDYLAAHAPVDVPDWFTHREPEYTVPPRPDYMALDTEEHRKIALDWQRDPCFDLPEELAWFGKKMQAHRTALLQRNDMNRAARFFQWRWFYADAMIAEREVV